MEKQNATWDDFLLALDDIDGYKIDYVDALTLQRMKKSKISEIYSNDKDFDRVEWVKRIWE
jgi:predicted nucleic acid-binding protein